MNFIKSLLAESKEAILIKSVFKSSNKYTMLSSSNPVEKKNRFKLSA